MSLSREYDGDDHENADDEDDAAPAQDLAILDHLVLALRGHIQVGAQLTCFFYLIAKVDSDLNSLHISSS